MRKLKYPILIVAIGIMFSTMTATQATPAQSKFYACMKKTSGAIRIVSPTKKCTKQEIKINWGITGPQGIQGLQGDPGAPGADGQDGVDGVDGIDGVDGGYEVMLNATDFTTYTFATLSNLESVYLSSLPRSVWAIQHANFGVESIMASFPTPSSWTGATAAKVTVYWYAENSSGNIKLLAWGAGQSEGSSLGGIANYPGYFYDGVPSALSLITSDQLIPIGSNPEMIDVVLSRWMNSNVDTNSGKVYIIAAKVEPVFS